MTEREYASPLVATCRHCGAAPGEDCQTWLSGGYVKTRSHYSRWRDAQGVEIAALRALLQEATEGRECFEHQHPEDVHEQATCSCGAAICPEPATCLLGRADRLLGHTTHGECITFVCDGVAR